MSMAFIVTILLYGTLLYMSNSTIDCVINTDSSIGECYKSSFDTLCTTLHVLYSKYILNTITA